jgi:hypothetical protein
MSAVTVGRMAERGRTGMNALKANCGTATALSGNG